MCAIVCCGDVSATPGSGERRAATGLPLVGIVRLQVSMVCVSFSKVQVAGLGRDDDRGAQDRAWPERWMNWPRAQLRLPSAAQRLESIELKVMSPRE